MPCKLIFAIFIYMICSFHVIAKEMIPFPQNLSFEGCIKPNNVTQKEMNSTITSLFDHYKQSYLTKAKNTPNGYYISAKGIGEGGATSLTISEAHGYGMMIYPLMAGYDKEAQTIFDGLFRFFKDHPSSINPYNMSWVIDQYESDTASTSAADGDMDIAYGLILAHCQWGSEGDINYLAEAQTLIEKGIKVSNMSRNSHRVLLGDWSSSHKETRSSDWLPNHMRAYAQVAQDSFWDIAADTIYTLIDQITQNYSPNTGLMPDFITGSPAHPDDSSGGTGEPFGDQFGYNACRYPWRIATDYAHYKTPEAQKALDKLTIWLKKASQEDPKNIGSGYKLSGEKRDSTSSLCFIAPFATAAIVDKSHQNFLNKLWAEMTSRQGRDSYNCAINLMSMLLISGNWWIPGTLPHYKAPLDIYLTDTTILENQNSSVLVGSLTTDLFGEGANNRWELLSGDDNFTLNGNNILTDRMFNRAAGDSSFTIRLKTTDSQNISIQKEFTILVRKAGKNILHQTDWKFDMDKYGSTVDTGAALIDEQIEANFYINWSDSKNGYHTFGTIGTAPLKQTLKNTKTIEITYKSDNSFKITLPMEEVTNYAYHFADLPSTWGSWKTVKLTINGSTFRQPSWNGIYLPFDAADINRILIGTNFEGTNGTIAIRSIEVSDFIENQKTGISKAALKTAKALTLEKLTPHTISLTIPQKGEYAVTIYNMLGRRIGIIERELQAGVQTLQWQGASLGVTPVLLQIEGAGHKTIQKRVLQ